MTGHCGCAVALWCSAAALSFASLRRGYCCSPTATAAVVVVQTQFLGVQEGCSPAGRCVGREESTHNDVMVAGGIAVVGEEKRNSSSERTRVDRLSVAMWLPRAGGENDDV